MTQQTQTMMPIGIAALPDGATPCASCGHPTEAGPLVPRRRLAREVVTGGGGVRVQDADGVFQFGLCPACAFRHDLARAIAERHPGLLALGSPSITADRLASALDALAAVGALSKGADLRAARDLYLHSESAARSLLTRLGDLGAAAAWAYRFSPVQRADARADTCAAPTPSREPWLFVPADLVADIRRQIGEHLQDRMPPRPYAAPADSRWRGCVVCGVGTIDARRLSEAWTVVAVGAYAGGHVCPADAGLLAEAGALGISPALVERAVLDYIDPERELRRRRPHEPDLGRIAPWAAGHAPGTPGLAERFGYLDTDGLLRDLWRMEW